MKVKTLCLLLILFVSFFSCDLGGSSDEKKPVDTVAEAAKEEEVNTSLNEIIDIISGMDSDSDTFNEDLEAQIAVLDEDFDGLLVINPDNAIGNLGKAFTGFAEAMASDEIQALFSSEDMSSQDPLSPGYTASAAVRAIEVVSENSIDINTVITDSIIAQLDISITHLEKAIANMGDSTIVINANVAAGYEINGFDESGNSIEIDVADIYIPLATMNIFKGVLEFVATWDYSVINADGDEVDVLLTLQSLMKGPVNDADELMALLMINIDPEGASNFMGFNDRILLSDSKASFLAAVQAVKGFDTAVNSEEDSQVDDLIPNTSLDFPDFFTQEMESTLAGMGITAEITSITSIAEVVEDLLNGDEAIELRLEESGIVFDINISALFNLASNTANGLRDFFPVFDAEGMPSFPEGYDPTFGGILTISQDGNTLSNADSLDFLLMLMTE